VNACRTAGVIKLGLVCFALVASKCLIIDTSLGLRLHRYVPQKVIILSVIRLRTEELNTCMITYTAGELLALQPTNITIPRTVRKSLFYLDFGVRANNGHSVTREFRHVTCFPAPTQLITVSQENTWRRPLSAVVMHSPRSFSAVWIYARY